MEEDKSSSIISPLPTGEGSGERLFYLSLGTNLGDKEQNLRTAVEKIKEQVGNVVSLSAFHTTAPWGFTSPNSFLNAALCVETSLTPLELLHTTQRIEREMGRTEKSTDGTYHDRLIDIDLLLCFTPDGTPVTIHTPELTIPHPLMQDRDFVMRPLREILIKKLRTEDRNIK